MTLALGKTDIGRSFPVVAAARVPHNFACPFLESLSCSLDPRHLSAALMATPSSQGHPSCRRLSHDHLILRLWPPLLAAACFMNVPSCHRLTHGTPTSRRLSHGYPILPPLGSWRPLSCHRLSHGHTHLAAACVVAHQSCRRLSCEHSILSPLVIWPLHLAAASHMATPSCRR